MPNFDLIEFFKISFKLVVFSIIVSIVLRFMIKMRELLGDLISKLGGSLSILDGIDLGCVGLKTGFADFLNALLNSMYLGIATAVSGVIMIFIFKYSILLYGHVKNI